MKKMIACALLIPIFTCLAFQGIATAGKKPAPCKINGKVIKSLKDCPTEGCTGRGDSDLSTLKNRLDTPSPSSVTPKTIADIVALNRKTPTGKKAAKVARETGELSALGEGKAVSVEGFLVHGDKAGLEVCNCFIDIPKSTDNLDFHLNLSKTKQPWEKIKKKTLVVEISPRSPMRSKGWTIAKVRALSRRQVYVRVTGWLLYDSEHANIKTMPRATAWEIHPVTKFEVCIASKVKDCKDDKWVALEDLP